MDQEIIKQAIDKIGMKPDRSQDLMTSNDSLIREVFEVKYSVKPICQLNHSELMATCIAGLTRISLITGWVLPADDKTRGFLYHEYSLLLTEQYNTINQEEIAYSMRKFGTKIRDWGKNVNLSLISEALDAYLCERVEVSKIEEFKKLEPLKQLPPAEVDWSEYWADLESGKTKIFFEPVYLWAIKNKKITEPSVKVKNEYLNRASIELRQELLNEKILESQIKERQNEFKNLLHPAVIKRAKELIIKDQL